MSTPNTDSAEITERVTLPHTIPLDEPVELGKETLHEITFKNRLTAGMLSHIPVGGTQKMGDFLPIVSKMTGETSVTIERLGYADLVKCITVVSGFFTTGTPSTGEASR